VQYGLDVPTFATRRLHAAEGGTVGDKCLGILPKITDFHVTFRDLLRQGSDGFISPPKEGVLRLKIRWLRPGANPRTWVPKASTLPLDHRSPFLLHDLVPYALKLGNFAFTTSWF
jgi:hypothetical protein